MKNHILHELTHGAGNPRNSEGAFATLTDGRLLFAYTRYTEGRGGDDDKADIAGVYSSDDGRTWSDTPRILVPNDGSLNVMSVSLIRLPDGRLAMIYLRKDGMNDCRPFIRYSTDEGETWSPRGATFPYKGYLILNNDRVIQLSSGRLVLPIAQHWKMEGAEAGDPFFDQRGHFFVIVSDDAGATWKVGPERWTLPSGRDYLQEPGTVELKDGRLWTFLRTNTGRQWQTFSSDGGDTWTLPEPSRFHSPRSPLSMKRIPSTGDLLAVWNDTALSLKLWGPERALNTSGSVAGKSWGRTPLVAAVSRNDGRTWGRSRILEKEPDHGYCYTAIHFTDDAVLLAYCCGGGESGHVLQDLRIRRVPLKWLYGRGA